MSAIQQQLISKARGKYGQILPCGVRGDLVACFTTEGSRVIFWYNTADGSTHIEETADNATN